MALLSVELTMPTKARAGSVVTALAKVKTKDERPARNVLLRTGKITTGTVSATCTQTLDGACRLGDLDQSGIQVPVSITINKTAKGKKLTLVVAVRGTGTAITKVSKTLTVTAPAKAKPSASASPNPTVTITASVSPAVVVPPPGPVTPLPTSPAPGAAPSAQTPIVASSGLPLITSSPDPAASLGASPTMGVAGTGTIPTLPPTTTQPAELQSVNGPLAGDNLMLVVHTAWLTALMVCVLLLVFKINRRRKRILTAALQHGAFPEPDPPIFQRIAGSSAPSVIIAICLVLPATGLLIVAQKQDLAIYLIAAAIAIPQATRAIQQWRENMRTGARPGQPPEIDAAINSEDVTMTSEDNPSFTAKVRITRL
jgi:hypothetical protein